MSKKKLIFVVLGIICLGVALFLYLFTLKKIPGISSNEAPIDLSRPPKFLYAINNDPKHPLERPMSVIVVTDKIFVADAGTKQVLEFDYNGKFKSNLKLPGNLRFKDPYGLATDQENLYVSDTGEGKIYVFDLDGNYLKEFPVKGTTLGGPAGLYFRSGRLYVADLHKHQVFGFDPGGKLLQTFGKEGNKVGELYFPHAIVAEDHGTLYVSDSGNNRVQLYDGVGQVINEPSSRSKNLLTPRGITMDQNEDLWIVSGLENQVKVYSFDGTNVLNWGISGKEYGMLSLPNGIFIDGNNRVYITELGNRRVSVFSY